MTNIYAIGDLHGRYDILLAVIEKIEEHAGDAGGKLIVTGDFIDRGPDSAKIVEHLRIGPNPESNWEWVVLKGNHEDMMLQCLARMQLDWWIGNGGGATMKSYGYKQGDLLMPLKIPDEDLEWLNGLPICHLEEKQAFVHAGFNPNVSLEEQNQQEMMWMRAPREDNYSFMGRHVVHGHEQYADGPILNPDKSNFDTFAWATGRQAIGVFTDAAGPPVEILEVKLAQHEAYHELADYYGWDDE